MFADNIKKILNPYFTTKKKGTGLGFGIFADNIRNILNPYFTTKKKGTGLGLSIVNKIINDHNGKINFVSLENGAKIEIMFIK